MRDSSGRDRGSVEQPRVTPVGPKKTTTIWIVAGVVIALLLLCACIAIGALFALVPSQSAEDGDGVGTQSRDSLYVKPDDDFDTALISGAESVAVGCVLYYNQTGQKPTIEGIEDTLEPYVQPWPTNPFTEQPLECGNDGAGCLEVKSLEPGLGPNSADVIRVLLSTGEWHEIEVPYP